VSYWYVVIDDTPICPEQPLSLRSEIERLRAALATRDQAVDERCPECGHLFPCPTALRGRLALRGAGAVAGSATPDEEVITANIGPDGQSIVGGPATATSGDPKCNGMCHSASDFIGTITYAHPECPLHGDPAVAGSATPTAGDNDG
jgi:hypothetical protein